MEIQRKKRADYNTVLQGPQQQAENPFLDKKPGLPTGVATNNPTMSIANATETRANAGDGTPAGYRYVIDDDAASEQKPVEDKYAYLKEAAASDLLSAGTQATIAETIARKNLASDLQRQGLANAGYAGTASAMISNSGAQQRANAQTIYNRAMMEIAQQEQADADALLAGDADRIASSLSQYANKNERYAYLMDMGLVNQGGKWVNGENTNFTGSMLADINTQYALANSQGTASDNTAFANSILTYASNASSAESLAKYLENLGFEQTNGVWFYTKGDGKVSQSVVDQINAMYASAASESGNETNGYSIEDIAGLRAGSNFDKTFADEYPEEYNTLIYDVQNKNINDGDVIMFKRGDNKGIEFYLRYDNGVFIPMSDSEVKDYNGKITQYTGHGKDIINTESSAESSSEPKNEKGGSEESGEYEDKPMNSTDQTVGKTADGRNVYSHRSFGGYVFYYYVDPKTGERIVCDKNGNKK